MDKQLAMPIFLYAPDCCNEIVTHDVDGFFYRAIQSDKEITAKDFAPRIIETPEKVKTITSNKKKCALYGTSVFSNVDELRKKQQTYPEIGLYVAYAMLTKHNGKVYANNSKSSHAEWYPYENQSPELFFSILTQGADDTP